MKRQFILLGFAMLTGLPHAVCAKGFGKEERAQSYGSWHTPYSPHYGSDGVAHPLMDHLAAPISTNAVNNWKMEFSPPRIEAAEMDSPLQGRDKRVGIRFRLSF